MKGSEYNSAQNPYASKIDEGLSDDDYMKEVSKRATSHVETTNRGALKTLSNDPFSPPPHGPVKRLKRTAGKSSPKR